MFSGKSELLIDRLIRAQIAKKSTILFKHSVDDRYSASEVVSHRNSRLEAHPVSSAQSLLEILGEQEVIGVDEVQFFTPDIVPVLYGLVKGGRRVIVAGLDMDFLDQPFKTVQELTSRATFIEKLHAVCDGCYNTDAARSQLLRDGVPVTQASNSIVVGGKDLYEARCQSCFIAKEHP